MLGYAGWSRGQLENELKQDVWLAAPANRAMIFDCPRDDIEPRLPHLRTGIAHAGRKIAWVLTLGFNRRCNWANAHQDRNAAYDLKGSKASHWTQVEQLVIELIASSLGCHSTWTSQPEHLLSYPANLRAALKAGSADPRT